MAARKSGNRYAAPGGGGPAPDDAYLNHPRGTQGAASMTRTNGTDAAGALNASSSVADYLKARGAAPADGMGRSKPPVRRGGAQPNARAGGGGKGPGGRPNSMAQGGRQRGGGQQPAPPAVGQAASDVNAMRQGGPVRGASDQAGSDVNNMRQGGPVRPAGGVAQQPVPPIGAASGNPSAARAAAFNAQRLAGPARPVADNGLAGRPNPSGGAPVGTVQPMKPVGSLGPIRQTGVQTGVATGPNGPPPGGMAGPQRTLGPPSGAPQPATPKINTNPSPSNAPNAGGIPQPAAATPPKPQGPSPGGSSTGAGGPGRIVTPRGGRASLA